MPQHPKFSEIRVYTVCRKLVYIQTKKIPSMSDELGKKITVPQVKQLA